MLSNLTVIGAKQFNGEVEGQKFNHTKLLVMLPFPRARATSNIGFDAIDATYGTSDNFKQFEGKKFPLVIEADYEINTKGIEIFEVKIQPQAQPPK